MFICSRRECLSLPLASALHLDLGRTDPAQPTDFPCTGIGLAFRSGKFIISVDMLLQTHVGKFGDCCLSEALVSVVMTNSNCYGTYTVPRLTEHPLIHLGPVNEGELSQQG